MSRKYLKRWCARGPGGRLRGGEPRRPGVIYNYIYIYENTQPRFPLLGLKLKNTSGPHLIQGPITMFGGSSYAGDARVMGLQPNEERLVSYAVGLGTEVKPEAAADGGRLTHVQAVKGVLHTTTKLRETKTFTVKNRNPQGQAVLIGRPVKDQFQRVDTTMLAQTARNAYRFEAQVPVGKTATLAVTEERDLTSAALLTDSPDEQVRLFLQSSVVSNKVKEGLRKALELRWKWARARHEASERQRQLRAVAEGQARLRANLRPALRGNRRGPPARLAARGTRRPAGRATTCRFLSVGVEARPHRDDPTSVSVQPRE
jgi:hypothetical protein